MKGSKEVLLRRFRASFEMLKSGYEMFDSAVQPMQRRYHWTAIVKHNHNATKALISAAMSEPVSKVIGHRMKNTQKDDEILNFVHRSRNAEDHPEDGDESSGSLVVPNTISIAGIMRTSGMQIFDNCTYEENGIEYDLHGTIGIVDGKPYARMRSPVPLQFDAETFVLEAVRDQQGKLHSVPGLKGDDYGKARHFAAHCIAFLDRFSVELE